MRYLLIVPVLLLAACGGSESNASNDQPQAREPAPSNRAVVDPPVSSEKDLVEARRLFDESELLSTSGDNTAAAEKLERAIELSPLDGEIRARLGYVYIKLLRYEDARDTLMRATELLEGEPERQIEFLASWCSYKLAYDAYQRGSYEDALDHLNDALDLQPEYVDAKFLLGNIYKARKEYSEAADVFSSISADTTGEPRFRALSGLGEVQYHAGEYRKAIGTFTKLIDLSAEGYEAYGWRGYCHVQIGDRESAVRDFTQAVQRTGSAERRADYEEKLQQLSRSENEGE